MWKRVAGLVAAALWAGAAQAAEAPRTETLTPEPSRWGLKGEDLQRMLRENEQMLQGSRRRRARLGVPIVALAAPQRWEVRRAQIRVPDLVAAPPARLPTFPPGWAGRSGIELAPVSNPFPLVAVSGYLRRDGRFVAPHFRTRPNASRADNLSTRRSLNLFSKAGRRR